MEERIKEMPGGPYDAPSWAVVCVGTENSTAVLASAFGTKTFEDLGISAENCDDVFVFFLDKDTTEGPDKCYGCEIVQCPS